MQVSLLSRIRQAGNRYGLAGGSICRLSNQGLLTSPMLVDMISFSPTKSAARCATQRNSKQWVTATQGVCNGCLVQVSIKFNPGQGVQSF